MRRAACRRGLAALLLVQLVGSGCYLYTPIQTAAVRPNEEVRIRITESAATRLVKEFGAYTGQLDGQLAPEGADSISIAVAIGREYRGQALENARQTLFLGRSEVVEIRRRQLSRGRTALATALLVAGFGLLVHSVVQQGDPNPPDDNTPQPPPPFHGIRIRIPIR